MCFLGWMKFHHKKKKNYCEKYFEEVSFFVKLGIYEFDRMEFNSIMMR